MTASPPETPSRRLLYFWGAAIAVLILILFVTFRRRDSDPVATAPDDSATEGAADAELRGQLLATLDGLLPERLHVSSDEQNIVGDLNLWWAEFAAKSQVADDEEHVALVGEWLGEEAAANAAATRFSARDASHIRNALLYRAIAATLVAGYSSDRERATAAFDLVVRQISLMSVFVEPAPLGSLEVLLAGRGTPDDRIWVFAEILRQLGMDCVVIEPKTPIADAPLPAKLVGAIVEGEGVLLFDPQMGLPIPVLDDTSGTLPTRAASFSDVLQNDAVFRQFDVPEGPPYPWSSAALAEADVRIIVDSTYAASRMLTLQTALPADFAATLYDGPPLSEKHPSLAARVIGAGADGLWSAESVTAWPYPERQMRAFFEAGGEASADAQKRLATLYGPKVLQLRQVERGQQVANEFVPVDSRRPLRIVRVQHLRGELLLALTGYGEVRSAPSEAGNAEVREDAIHWIAVCQTELERFDVAISTLALLIRDYPNGLWSTTSQRSLARCEAFRENLQQAGELMQQADEGQTPDLANAFLVRRWQSQAATSPSTTDASAE